MNCIGTQHDMRGGCAHKEVVILIPRSGRRIPVFGCGSAALWGTEVYISNNLSQ